MLDQRTTRRRAIGIAAGAGAALLGGAGLRAGRELLTGLDSPNPADAATGLCTLDTPTMTEGPYWVDELLNRSDVRSNSSSASVNAGAVQDGVPLTVTINVYDADRSCAPLQGAQVDIWHANATGAYSDESVQGTKGQNFLRGYQVTDAAGSVTFKTIYPGWYRGRAIHIHVRIRTFSGSSTAFDYTTQIFFSDEQNNAVMTGAAPYKQRSPQTPDTSDGQDNILDESHSPNNAKTNLVSLSGSNSAGYSGTFDVALAGVTGGGGTVVAAGTIKSANVARTTTGKRLLTLVLTLHERTSVSARLTHGSTVLAKKSGTLAAGTRTLRLAIGSRVPAERARLTVKLTGASGTTATRRRSLTIPVRR